MVISRSANTPLLGVADPRLCLDFVNTEGVERNSPPDRLESFELFLEWAEKHDLIDAGRSRKIRRASGGKRPTDRFLAIARELREALYRIFARTARGRTPADSDLGIVDRYLAKALPRLRLTRERGGYAWRLSDSPGEPAELLWPIALSAADLLCSERLDRVKECSGETCSWMFIDESRNRSRRWCDMSDCGNRAKAKRFYRRHSSSSS